jgi:hypothetical protein
MVTLFQIFLSASLTLSKTGPKCDSHGKHFSTYSSICVFNQRSTLAQPGPMLSKIAKLVAFCCAGIRTPNYFTLQFMPSMKSVHGMIFILLSFQNKIFIASEF